jgi:hypothetical protein
MMEPDAVPAGPATRMQGARAVAGLRPEALRPPAGSRLTAASFTSPLEARPACRKTPLWRAERRPRPRERMRHYPVRADRRATPSAFSRGKTKRPTRGRAKEYGRRSVG